MSNPFEYDYSDAKLDICLPGGWKFHVSFHDDSKCNTVEQIHFVDPNGYQSQSFYYPTVCIYGPPFFLLHEALWIIDAIYNDSSNITVPQIYALLLPVSEVELTTDEIRDQIEEKYDCQLKGKVWNRVSHCQMTRDDLCDLTFDEECNDHENHWKDLLIDWDEEYPVEPKNCKSYVIDQWEESKLSRSINPNGPFGIEVFHENKDLFYSYRTESNDWMYMNGSFLARFLTLMNPSDSVVDQSSDLVTDQSSDPIVDQSSNLLVDQSSNLVDPKDIRKFLTEHGFPDNDEYLKLVETICKWRGIKQVDLAVRDFFSFRLREYRNYQQYTSKWTPTQKYIALTIGQRVWAKFKLMDTCELDHPEISEFDRDMILLGLFYRIESEIAEQERIESEIAELKNNIPGDILSLSEIMPSKRIGYMEEEPIQVRTGPIMEVTGIDSVYESMKK